MFARALPALAVWLLVVAPALAQPAPASPTPAPPAAAPQVSAAELVSRYVSWRGGAAYQALKSIHEVLQPTTGGGQREIWLTRDGQRRIETDLGGPRTVAGAGPDGGWQANVSGQVTDAPDAREDARRYAALVFGDALTGGAGASVALHGTARVGERTLPTLRITFGDADSYDAVIDPDSGALCCYRIVRRGVPQIELFSDWRAVDGVQMPFTQLSQSALERVQAAAATLEINRDIDAALFRRPTPAPLVGFAGGAPGSGWIGFELYDDRQIRLPVSVAGHPAEALLDSGASASALDLAFAQGAGLTAAGSTTIAGAEGASHGGFVSGVSIEAGAMRMAGLTALAVDLAPVAALIGRPTPVVMGQEAFNEAVVDVDFAGHRVAFLSPASFTPPAGAIDLPLGPKGVPIAVEGGAPANFQIDLGDADAIDLFPAFIAARGLGQGRTVSQVLKFGIEGPQADQVATLAAVTLGGARLSGVPADLQAHPQPGLDATVAGRIGIGLLRRFHVIIDYPQGHLYLIPDPAQADAAFDKDRVGLGLIPDGDALVVKLVAPGSPAAAVGFHADDRITRIDGEPAAAWNQLRLQQAFSAAPGAVLHVTLAGGATREVTLTDYF